MPNAEHALARLERFLEQAAPALGRALRSERKTVGMLHAIERLTNLYDLSKAFGSTIDIDELTALIVRKAADFVTGETACLWVLEGEDDVTVAGMAVNENYDVESPPDAVGAALVGDVIADQISIRRNKIPEDDPVATENPDLPGPLGPRRAPRRGRDLGRSARRREQARPPPGVHGRRRGALERPGPPGRPGPAERPPARGREEGRGARRPARRQPRDHGDPRSRQGDADRCQCHGGADRVRPVRDRHPGEGKAAARRDLRCDRGRPEGPRRPPDGRAPAVGLSLGDGHGRHPDGGRRDHGRPAGDRGEVPGPLPGDGAAVVLRRAPEGRGGQARRPRLREPRAPRLRRGDARPPVDPRQPGDGRRPQRPALPPGTAGRLLEAAPREETPIQRRAPGPAAAAGPSASPRPSWRSASFRGRCGSRRRRASFPAGGRP